MAGESVWWDRITSLAAVAIAVIALIFSFIESQRSEKFARLSIMPIVNIGNTTNGGFEKTVWNAGTGTAIIKWMAVIYEGRLIEHWEDYYAAIGIRDDIFDTLGMLWPGSSLLPGPENTVQVLQEGNPISADLLWTAQAKGNVQICYCSVYGDCAVAYERMGPGVEPVQDCIADKAYPALFVFPPNLAS